MKPITYKIGGVITFVSGILFFYNWIDLIGTGADGLWIPFIIGFGLFTTGVLYFLFGMGTFAISKLSNRSLGTMIAAFIVAVGGSILIILYLILIGAQDPMGIILILGPVYLGAIIASVAFFMLIIAVVKMGRSG